MEYICKAGQAQKKEEEIIRGRDYFHEYLCCWMAALMQSKGLDLFDKTTLENHQDRVSVIREIPNTKSNMNEEIRQPRFDYPVHEAQLQRRILETSKELPVTVRQLNTEEQQGGYMRMKAVRKADKGPYMCNDCGKILKRSSSLSNHRLIHKNIKAFKCEKCGASFLRKSDLGKHYAIHTGSKPYICNICNKSFSQSSNMLTHKRRHSGVKPFKCDYCLKSFYRKVDVKRHEIVHCISEGE